MAEGRDGITVRLENGTNRTATDSESALILLKDVFHWTPPAEALPVE
jgi:hypothetical protein